MSHRITGKSVVVTGGCRGIGRGLVQRLLERGNHVIATTRNLQDVQQQQQLTAQPERLTLLELDTSRQDSIASWAAQVKHICPHVDLLINNAGMYGKRGGFHDFQQDDFIAPFTTNAVGPFLVVQQLLSQGVIGGPPGATLVVNVTSIMSSHADPTVSSVTGGGYAYRASKAALNIINKAMAFDLAAQDISCVLVHPGYVMTDMTGGQGWVTVDESTDGILRLLEDGTKPLNGRFYSYTGDEIPW